MLYEVLGDIWVVRRNPYLQDDLLDNPAPAAPPGRGAAPPAGRDRPPPRRSRRASAIDRVGELLTAARERGAQFRERTSTPGRQLRRRARTRARDAARARTTSASTPMRACRHVTDATDWRVEYPFVVLMPDTEARDARPGARLHRARAHHHSARRRHRLHRRRRAADTALGCDQHREARATGQPSRCLRLPGLARARADDLLRGRRGHAPRGRGGGAGAAWCSRSIRPRPMRPASAATSR